MIEWLGPIVYEYYGATESYGFTGWRISPSSGSPIKERLVGPFWVRFSSSTIWSRAPPPGEVGNVSFVGGDLLVLHSTDGDEGNPSSFLAS